MLKRLLTALFVGGASTSLAADPTTSGPYVGEAPNFIYHILFCDRPELFNQSGADAQAKPWTTLQQDPPDYASLELLAEDESAESRVRALAYRKLRLAGKVVAPTVLLGIIVEVGMREGLDTLAVFTDGRARYINYTGKMAVVEGSTEFKREIDAVLAASKPIIAKIGPWDKDRPPPPRQGNVRLTFVVSDGLYFGEGPMEAMQGDPMAQPLIDAATALLIKLTDRVVEKK